MRLTVAEARATDGALCWRPKNPPSGWRYYFSMGPACSLKRYHDGPCRHDMDIKPDPMPRARFWRIVAISAPAGLLPGLLLGLVVLR